MAAPLLVLVRQDQGRVGIGGELQLLFRLAQQRRIDMSVRGRGRVREESVSEEEADGGKSLGPPGPPYDDELAVEAAEAPIGDGEPAAWPPDSGTSTA